MHSRILLLTCLLLSVSFLPAQIHYTLTYADSTKGIVTVTIQTDSLLPTPVTFIMPRSVPGGYGVTKYDLYVEHLQAISADGASRTFVKSSYGAPRWRCADSGFRVKTISYEVNIEKMDRQLRAASEKSILRSNFAGLLNYSIFGWIEGKDSLPVQCTVNTFNSWPIFSSIAPTTDSKKGRLAFNTDNYYLLADGQTFIGPAFQVKEYKALVPLFVADYSEGRSEFIDDYAWQEARSMEILKDYFGGLPFTRYTILIRSAVTKEDDDPGSFGMEHLQSSTFFGDTAGMRTGKLSEQELWERIPTYLHHMAHAFIPLRCYGDTYRPHVLEIPPVIHNIWFNEGFMWYIVYDTLRQKGFFDYFQNVVYHGAPTIRQMSLRQLSEVASTQYGDDFRLGTAIYSRGALMADEIDTYVKQQTGGKSSMRTIYRFLYDWSVKNKRPFTMEEFPGLLKAATGVDITAIYDKWQQPIAPFNSVSP